MPVEPIPCASDGGIPTPVVVTTCCSPSIGSAALCRPDGTMLLLVVQSGCAECGQDPGDPQVAGWIDTTTGAFTAGPPPADAGPCGAVGECEEPTQPVAMTGVCLADGTPISVVVTRDCDGVVTQEGWLNLTTGAWSAGQPPAGTIACGDSRSIQVSGTFCDIDPGTGDVLALVLIEYSYAADGSISSVRLVDATTGATYSPQGTITTCPAGVEEPEQALVRLCDVHDDESGAITPTPFVRDYRRDESGVIVGYSDYTLDGAPYIPSGTVGTCAQPCHDTTALLVCDVPVDGVSGAPAAADTDPTPYPWDAAPVRCLTPLAGGGAALWSGGSLTFGPDTAGDCNPRQVLRGVAATLTAPRPACDDGTATVTVSVRVTDDGPYDAARNFNGGLRLHRADNGERLAGMPLYRTVVGQPEVLTVQASVPAGLLAAGQVVAVLDLETYDDTDGNLGTVWTADSYTAAFAYDVAGCAVQFLRTVVTDCETGAVVATTDTTLDGSSPYTVTGQAGQCTPAGGDGGVPEPCRDTTSVLLCDAAAGTETVPPTVTDATLADTHLDGNAAFPLLPKPWTPLWSGGQLVFPADPDGSAGDGLQVYRTVVGRVTAAVPDECGAASGELTISVRVTNNGPSPGDGGTGWLWVYRDGGILTRVDVAHSAPVGHVQTLTATVPVTPADLSGGAITLALALETYHTAGPKAWTADQFTVSGELDGCAVQFMRTLTVDCGTGQVVQVTDSTLDGAPYTVTGQVGQCAPAGGAGGPVEPCRQSSSLLVCDSAGGQNTVTPDITDGESSDISYIGDDPSSWPPLPKPWAPLWAGDPLTFPTDPDGSAGNGGQVYRTVIGRISAAVPDECAAASGTLTVSVRVTLDGPNPGNGHDGSLRLFRDTAPITADNVLGNAPVGHVQTLTVQAPVTAAELANGEVFLGLWLETFHNSGPKQWTADQFTIGAELDGCEVQFLRTVTTGCDGTVVAITDTTLDGAPYTVTGDVGQCTTVAEPDTPCGDTELVVLCDLGDESPGESPGEPFGEPVRFLRRFTFGCDGLVVSTADLTLDGLSYTPTGEVVACDEVDDPHAPIATEVECRCDDTDGDGIGDVDYVAVVTIAADGTLASVGTYLPDLSARYTPVAPVPCPISGGPTPVLDAEPVTLCDTGADGTVTAFLRHLAYAGAGPAVAVADTTLDGQTPYTPSGTVGLCPATPGAVQALRLELGASQSWDLAGEPLAQSVTATAVSGDGEVTDEAGTTTLHPGETATWSVTRDQDQNLRGPLVIAATTGVVTLNITRAVT